MLVYILNIFLYILSLYLVLWVSYSITGNLPAVGFTFPQKGKNILAIFVQGVGSYLDLKILLLHCFKLKPVIINNLHIKTEKLTDTNSL